MGESPREPPPCHRTSSVKSALSHDEHVAITVDTNDLRQKSAGRERRVAWTTDGVTYNVERPAEHKQDGSPSEPRPLQRVDRSSSEYRRLLNLGNLSNRDILRMFEDLDTDQDGKITFHEFCDSLEAKLNCKLAVEALRDHFQSMDRDGNGSITREELLETAEADRTFNVVDADHSGYASILELTHYMKRQESNPNAPYTDEDLFKLAQALDTSGDGRVEINEFRRGVLLTRGTRKRRNLRQIWLLPILVLGLLALGFCVEAMRIRNVQDFARAYTGFNTSALRHAPEETVPFGECGFCARCMACKHCYHGETRHYDRRHDQCVLDEGECGLYGELSFCAEVCTPVVVFGTDGLYCAPDENSFCHYRDPAVPTARGHDIADGRPGIQDKGPQSVYLPEGYTPTKQYPLLVALGGRTWCGHMTNYRDAYRELAHSYGYIYMAPDPSEPYDFWCNRIDKISEPQRCNNTDDPAYLMSLVEDVQSRYSVSDVFFFGLSNGAVMAVDMACRFASKISGVMVNEVGLGWLAPDADHPQCAPDAPINMLVMHDAHDMINSFQSAPRTLEYFAKSNGCDTTMCPSVLVDKYDLLPKIKGVRSWPSFLTSLKLAEEEETYRYSFPRCDEGGSADIWVTDSVGSQQESTRILIPGYPHYKPLAHETPAAGVLPNSLADAFLAESGHANRYGLNNDAGVPFAMQMHVIEWMLEHTTDKLARSGLTSSTSAVPDVQPRQEPLRLQKAFAKADWDQEFEAFSSDGEHLTRLQAYEAMRNLQHRLGTEDYVGTRQLQERQQQEKRRIPIKANLEEFVNTAVCEYYSAHSSAIGVFMVTLLLVPLLCCVCSCAQCVACWDYFEHHHPLMKIKVVERRVRTARGALVSHHSRHWKRTRLQVMNVLRVIHAHVRRLNSSVARASASISKGGSEPRLSRCIVRGASEDTIIIPAKDVVVKKERGKQCVGDLEGTLARPQGGQAAKLLML